MTSSRVATGIDLLNGERDRQVVMVEMEVKVSVEPRCTKSNTRMYDREAARVCKHEGEYYMLSGMALCGWDCDVNAHWAHIRDHVQQKCTR